MEYFSFPERFAEHCRSRLEVRRLPIQAIAQPNHRFSSKNYSKGRGEKQKEALLL
ncbi:MAG: hypothetical protein ACKO4S_00940 [Snowella sp.]